MSAPDASSGDSDISVVICAYTTGRWNLTVEAVESARAQSRPPAAVTLVIDNNEALLERAAARWASSEDPRVIVVAHSNAARPGTLDGAAAGVMRAAPGGSGAGPARNTGLSQVRTPLVAFLDDDARAEYRWLETLAGAHHGGVTAVGGAPLPDYSVPRPPWFPQTFDWIFGCAYFGMPTQRRPYPRLIGANMSMRTEALNEIGGFGSADFDDLDVCTRLAERYGAESVVYEPAAIVRHHVPANRMTLRYLLRRAYFVNREKVRPQLQMPEPPPLAAEIAFVLTVPRYALHESGRALRGDAWALIRIVTALAGVGAAAAGYLVGHLRYRALALLNHKDGRDARA